MHGQVMRMLSYGEMYEMPTKNETKNETHTHAHAGRLRLTLKKKITLTGKRRLTNHVEMLRSPLRIAADDRSQMHLLCV